MKNFKFTFGDLEVESSTNHSGETQVHLNRASQYNRQDITMSEDELRFFHNLVGTHLHNNR